MLVVMVAVGYSIWLIWLLKLVVVKAQQALGTLLLAVIRRVPIVEQAVHWIHCAMLPTMFALNFSLVGTCSPCTEPSTAPQ